MPEKPLRAAFSQRNCACPGFVASSDLTLRAGADHLCAIKKLVLYQKDIKATWFFLKRTRKSALAVVALPAEILVGINKEIRS